MKAFFDIETSVDYVPLTRQFIEDAVGNHYDKLGVRQWSILATMKEANEKD